MGRLIFAAPIAGLLAGLLAMGIVVLLYLLKLRRRPVPVSSTMLWIKSVRDMEGNVPWQAARPSVLMFLHLLIIALLALAIARPSIGVGASDQRVVLVLDTSASMNAIGDDGDTAFENAKDEATRVVRALGNSARTPEIIVYHCGSEPRLVSGPTRDTRRVLRELGSIQASDERGTLEPCFELIQSMINAADATELADSESSTTRSRVIVLTDAAGGTDLPAGVAGAPLQPIIVGARELSNVGIVALSATRDRADPAVCRLFVRVQSTSSDPIGIILRVLDGDEELARVPIALDAVEGDTPQNVATTIPVRIERSADLRVQFDRTDALAIDNTAWIFVPDPSPVRIAVVADGLANPVLLDVLEAVAGIAPDVVQSNESIPAWSDLIVYDGVMRSDKQGSHLPSISFVGTGDDREAGAATRVLTWDRTHPALRDVAMETVVFARTRMLDDESSGSARVLASGKRDAVITEQFASGVRKLEVAFDLDDSNWVIQVGFAIFMINATEYLVPGASGVGETILSDASRPHVGAIEIETEQGVRTLGVSLLSSDESLLGFRSSQTDTRQSLPTVSSAAIDIQKPIARWFLLAAALLMMIEWFLHASRLRV